MRACRVPCGASRAPARSCRALGLRILGSVAAGLSKNAQAAAIRRDRRARMLAARRAERPVLLPVAVVRCAERAHPRLRGCRALKCAGSCDPA